MMEDKIYQILRQHKLPLKKREELMVDLLALLSPSSKTQAKIVHSVTIIADEKELDHSLEAGEKVWFTYKQNPKEEGHWIEVEILDLNWAFKSAAIQIKGYKGVSCHGISSLHREKLSA